ncbi:plasmid mobilization protein [Paraburkholderia silvatlantica]|uniref:plasmid mobilization protein n=1 Tax=Paraburkholderia silvatlantica TaxID=321895 RepID=UPI00105B52EB|nr:plasmid mobilization relaxosome protein MobC [Paraburkholderia silvatlantica]TDQ75488.1 hypothetical protein C7412_1425 [Paraburkholderia silvatlantica]
MDQQHHEAFASPIKKQAGQSGIDGNTHRRDRRIEIRVSEVERDRIGECAIAAGYDNLARYLRETALANPITPPSRDDVAWLQAVNRIGNYVAEIAVRLNDGHQPDEEILLVLMQTQEYAEEIWKAVRQGRGTGEA